MRKTSEVIRVNILRRNLVGYILLKEWDEDLQDEDDYQAPDKFQSVSKMVFPYRFPGDPPVKHHGGGCSNYDLGERMDYSV